MRMALYGTLWGWFMMAAAPATALAAEHALQVLPPHFADTDAGGGSSTLKDSFRMQQVYSSEPFPQTALLIEEIRFRPSAVHGQAFTSVVEHLQINLSSVTYHPTEMSRDFADNVGLDDMVVFDGSVELSSRFVGPEQGPKEFDIVIPLQHSFYFDPSEHNLLIDIRNFSGSESSLIDAGGGAGWGNRAFAQDTDALRAGSNPDGGCDVIGIRYRFFDGRPRILIQPASQTVNSGGRATFRAEAIGEEPLYYQWLWNGETIPGANDLVLVLEDVTEQHAGFYRISVSNQLDVVLSSEAQLFVQTNMVGNEDLILPWAYSETEAGAGATTLSDKIRLQEVYSRQYFTNGPVFIYELAFRPSARYGKAFQTLVENLEVRLSATAVEPRQLSISLDQNVGPNQTVVFAGPILLSSQFLGPPGGPKEFDIRIPLQTPFFYDPAEGNLLVDIVNGSAADVSQVDAGLVQSGLASRAFVVSGVNSGSDDGADVIQFKTQPPNMAPRFGRDPEDRLALTGDHVTMSAFVTGTLPLWVQWMHGQEPIDGANAPVLDLFEVDTSDVGDYWVWATNIFGASTSRVATLTITNWGRLVLPGEFAEVEGGAIPQMETLGGRQQFVYDAAWLPDRPLLLQQLRLRPGVRASAPFQEQVPGLEVRLSTTSKRPDELGEVLDENMGYDATMVFAGDLIFSSEVSGPAEGPKAFDLVVPFSEPFAYHPSDGQLLVELRNLPKIISTQIDFSNAPEDGASRASAVDTDGILANIMDSAAPVVEVVFAETNEFSELTLLREPQDTSVQQGETARMHVVAWGGWPLTYQWHKYGGILPGETNRILVLPNAQPHQTGIYTVAVSHGAEQLISEEAVLNVIVPPPAQLLRGPYLQQGTTSRMLVKWRTDREVIGRIRYGTALDELSYSVGESIAVTDHEVALTGLVPDTRYFYSVEVGTNVLAGGPDQWFRTAPANPKPTRIWAIGDSGTATYGSAAPAQVQDAYLEYTGDRETDVWLMLGDNAYSSGHDSEYQIAVFDVYPELLRTVPLWPTIGNHELWSSQGDGSFPYLDIFTLPEQGQAGGHASGTERYYSFDFSNVHFVCLDSESSDKRPVGAMMTWLEADLTANTLPWVIAYWHSPPYSHGSHNSDVEGNLVQMRQWAVPILESHGVDLVLCGHSHCYERSYPLHGHYDVSTTLNQGMVKDAGSGRMEEDGAYQAGLADPGAHQGTVYIVAGSSGQTGGGSLNHPAMYMSVSRLGSMVIDIDGPRLDARFLRETGEVDDWFTVLKALPEEPFQFATIRVSAGVVTARWHSVPGAAYRLERADQLEDPQWEVVSEDIVATEEITAWSEPEDAEATRRRFYRVQRLP